MSESWKLWQDWATLVLGVLFSSLRSRSARAQVQWSLGPPEPCQVITSTRCCQVALAIFCGVISAVCFW